MTSGRRVEQVMGNNRDRRGEKHGVTCEALFDFCLFAFELIQICGAKETRTPDPLHAMQMLYQLSYSPES